MKTNLCSELKIISIARLNVNATQNFTTNHYLFLAITNINCKALKYYGNGFLKEFSKTNYGNV